MSQRQMVTSLDWHAAPMAFWSRTLADGQRTRLSDHHLVYQGRGKIPVRGRGSFEPLFSLQGSRDGGPRLADGGGWGWGHEVPQHI